jgi:hypothetical protein
MKGSCGIGYRMEKPFFFIERHHTCGNSTFASAPEHRLLSHDIIYIAIYRNYSIIVGINYSNVRFIDTYEIGINLYKIVSFAVRLLYSNYRIGYTELNRPSRSNRYVLVYTQHGPSFLQITDEAAGNALAYGTKTLLEMPREHYRSITGK